MMQEASKRRCNKIKLLSLSFVSKLIPYSKFYSIAYIIPIIYVVLIKKQTDRMLSNVNTPYN